MVVAAVTTLVMAMGGVAAGGVAASGAASAAETAYVVGQASLDVTPIAFPSGVAGTSIPVGTLPRDVAFSPDGKTAYVTNDAGDSVTQINVGSGTVEATIALPTGSGPQALAVSPDGSAVYVVDGSGNSVTPIAIATGVAGTPIPVGEDPLGIAFAPDGGTAYVADEDSDTVVPIDVATGKTEAAIAVAGGPVSLAVTPDGKTLYVATVDTDAVTPIDLATGATGAPIVLGSSPSGPTGAPPDIAISPNGTLAYVTSPTTDTVRPIGLSGGTGTAGTAISAGKAPTGVAFSPDGSTAYVADAGSDTVTPIDVSSGTAEQTITVGRSPWGVAFSPRQSPLAALSVSVGAPGTATSFDASGSTDPDGTIAGYDWSFGDGTSAMTTAPGTTHVYADPGDYTATVTVIDTLGCGALPIYTGQTAYCGGGSGATASQPMAIAAPGSATTQTGAGTTTVASGSGGSTKITSETQTTAGSSTPTGTGKHEHKHRTPPAGKRRATSTTALQTRHTTTSPAGPGVAGTIGTGSSGTGPGAGVGGGSGSGSGSGGLGSQDSGGGHGSRSADGSRAGQPGHGHAGIGRSATGAGRSATGAGGTGAGAGRAGAGGAGVGGAGGVGVGTQSSHRSEFATIMRRPDNLPLSLADVGRSVGLAILLLALLGLPARVFNATVKTHRAEFQAWLGHARERAHRLLPAPLHSLGQIAAVSVVTATVIHAFLNPGFPTRSGSAAFALGMLLAWVVIVLNTMISWRAYIARHAADTPGRWHVYTGQIGFSMVCVAVSRLAHFIPGLIMGMPGDYHTEDQLELDHRARRIAWTDCSLAVVSLIAWGLSVPIGNAAARPHASFLVLTLDAMTAVIAVAGMETLFFTLIPLAFLDGQLLRSWRPRVWFGLWAAGALWFSLVVLNPALSTPEQQAHASIAWLAGLLALELVIAMGLWTFFLLRERATSRTVAAGPGEQPGR